MNLKINQRHSEGFSLIELIFVITVIGILAGVSIPSLINWKYFQDLKTRQLALKTNLEQMKSDAKRWGAMRNRWEDNGRAHALVQYYRNQ